jgi:hypothetical protein
MRRIGLALGLIAMAMLPAYSQWKASNDVPQFGMFPSLEFQNGIPGITFIKSNGAFYERVWQPLSEKTCSEASAEYRNDIRRMPWSPRYTDPARPQDITEVCKQSSLVRSLTDLVETAYSQWEFYCKAWAQDYEAYRRSEQLSAGSRTGVVGSYSSQRIPDSGGAGGSAETEWTSSPVSEWTSSPAAVPDSGGAGGSENVLPSSGFAEPARKHPIGTTSATTQATQQACLNDPKTVDDAQLKALLANPQVHTRITSLIAEEPSPRKAKTERNQRTKRGRAPTDADIARSNSEMSPETANAIGTIIGVGIGVGLSNAGRRGGSAAQSGPTQRMTPRSTSHP